MKELNLTNFRTNLQRVRAFYGWSSKELSEKAKLRQLKRISDIEEGRGNPTLDEIHSICFTLDLSIDDMLYKHPKLKFD